MKFNVKKIDKAMAQVKEMNLEELEFIRKYVFDYIKLRVKYPEK